jgi:Ca-activated chloride channel family protein
MIREACGMLVLSSLLVPLGGGAHRLAERGNRHYDEEEYDDALAAYTEAQVYAPEAPELYYDIGNVLYRKGDFAGAAEAYTRALGSASSDLLPDAAFNLGNALYRNEQYEEAAAEYRRALKADPSDLDAKRNLELALRQLEQQQQQQQQQQDGENQENQDQRDQRQQQQDEGDQEQEQEQEQQQQPQQPSEEEQQQQEQEPQQPQQEPEPQGMSEEEARRLLDTLAEQERENLKEQAKRKVRARRRGTEEDW